MTSRPPSLYLFYGDDQLAMAEAVQGMIDRLGDASGAMLNCQRFSALNLDMDALETACRAQPFLSARRLIILQEADRLPRDQAWRDRFYQLLQDLPPSCALVLIETQDLTSTREEKRYRDQSPWIAWAQSHPDQAYIRRFQRPQGEAFVSWIMERCGGAIEPDAAQLLADAVDEDPQLADQELRKLLDYVDRARKITLPDVELLTPLYGQADIFGMVDALGQRDRAAALKLLYRLLQNQDAGYVFAMVVRQFRLLLQAREALDRGEQPSASLSLHPYVARKIADQARNFEMRDLETIYHQLLELDLAAKTGQADLSMDLEAMLSERAL